MAPVSDRLATPKTGSGSEPSVPNSCPVSRESALEEADNRRIRWSDASRLSESNRRPSHYE
ncbi:protein of unknown function [Modestobacter italicus]|uniref:Uncharacterized protein n=1 Tax=Modestobacter italicus (strain DSM 44449 / CECT 9708 / BC 501) TaxID=2732864 RepID=I4ERY3_MODI5|nr:protein of unknown function [Modestobacter marinus]